MQSFRRASPSINQQNTTQHSYVSIEIAQYSLAYPPLPLASRTAANVNTTTIGNEHIYHIRRRGPGPASSRRNTRGVAGRERLFARRPD
jgi:hypothetical protein